MELKIDDKKVKLGSAITKLGLEDAIISNLPANPTDSISIVRGVMAGLLERRDWKKAINFAYANDGVKTLLSFIQDGSEFKREVIDCIAKQTQPVVLPENAYKLLLQNWSVDELCGLVEQVDFSETRRRDCENSYGPELLHHVLKTADAEQTKRTFTVVGERAVAKGREAEAVKYFKWAKNDEKISELYESMLQNLGENNFHLVVEIAGKKNNRSAEFVRVFDAVVKREPDLLEKYVSVDDYNSSYFAEFLYKNNVIKREDKTRYPALLRAVAKVRTGELDSSCAELRKAQIEVRTENALKELAKKPARAYATLKSCGYVGPEIMEAARLAIEELCSDTSYSRDENLSHFINEFCNADDLRAVYSSTPQLPLDAKAKIARRLEDKKELLKLSKAFSEGKERNVKMAYSLWVKGGGDTSSRYAHSLRKELINVEISEQKEKKYCWIYHNMIEFGDKDGYIQFFDAIVDDFPRSAFKTATSHIEQDAYLNRARQRIFDTESTVDALKYFAHEKDAVGVELALEKFAAQEEVSKEALLPYVTEL